MAEYLEEASQLESTTVKINRTAATVKGGRRMSFAALVVVGDRRGSVGIGYGKAPGVPAAIEKAQKDARKNLKTVNLHGGTIPHPVTGKFGASQVRLIPAGPGSGVIAGGTVRAVLEMAGVHDCLTKAYRSTNEINVVKAVLDGLLKLRTRETVNRLRNVEIAKTDVDEIIENSRRFLTQEAAKAPAPKPLPVAEPKAQAEESAQAQAPDQAPAEAPTEVAAQAAASPEASSSHATTENPPQAGGETLTQAGAEAAHEPADQTPTDSESSGDAGEGEAADKPEA